jgi:hypothetical protein
MGKLRLKVVKRFAADHTANQERKGGKRKGIGKRKGG